MNKKRTQQKVAGCAFLRTNILILPYGTFYCPFYQTEFVVKLSKFVAHHAYRKYH